MYNVAIYILPEIIISVMSCFILIFDLFISQKKKEIIYYLSQITLLVIGLILFKLIKISDCVLFDGAFIFDLFSIRLKIVLVIVAFIVFLYSKKYITYIDLFKGEYFVLCLFSILGMMIMISSGTFLSLYLGLELLSLPIYSLIIMDKKYISSEASMKYFIMGSIASGIFLFGVSVAYGMSGSISFSVINNYIVNGSIYSDLTLQYGLVFIIGGLIFKFGAVPFHMWVPDVYEGSPIPVTLFIGTIPKIAALGMAYRLVVETFVFLHSELEFLSIVVGVTSLFIGNIFAISQIDIKRLLGYSAITHVGFMFCGFVAANYDNFSFILFYVFVYVLSSLGAFGIIMAVSSRTKEANLILHFKGLGLVYPIFGIVMLLFLLSLAGIPPTAGFYAKFFILKHLMFFGYVELTVYAILMSVVGAFYYLKVIKIMFFEDIDKDIRLLGMSGFGLFVLFLNGILILFIGICPSLFLKFCLKLKILGI